MNTVARLAAALLAAATFAVPMTSFAETTPPAPVAHGHKHHGDKAKAQFPMKADEFRAMVEKKIEKVKARVEKGLEKHKLPADQRVAITRAVDDAAKQIRTAVDKAATDGTVTKEEAKQVRELANQLRSKVRGELFGGKHARAGKAKPRQR
jgi:hypothetical protein